MNQQIVAYIMAARARGMSDEEIKKALLAAGWHEAAIDESLGPQAAPLVVPAPAASVRDAVSSVPADQPISKGNMDPLGKLFGDAWRLYGKKFWAFTAIMAVPGIVSLVGQVLLTTSKFSFLGMCVEFVGLVLYLIAFVAVMVHVSNDIGIRESLRKGMSLFWSFLWIGILIMVTMFGGFVLLIVPGILMATWFIFSQYILIVEGKRGMAALALSRAYTKGYWWAIFGRYLIVGLCVGIFSAVVSAVFVLPFGKAASTSVSTVVGIFTGPFLTTYVYLLYKNIVALKPGLAASEPNRTPTFFRISAIIGLLSPILIFILAITLTALVVFRGKTSGNSLQSIESQAAAIAGAADPSDASDISMIQQRELIGKAKAVTWQPDAEFSGYSQVLVLPSNGTSSNDVEFRYISTQAKMIYAISFVNGSTNVAQTDISQDSSQASSTKSVDLSMIAIGPQKAAKIALLVPSVQTFQKEHANYLFLAQFNDSFPGYWYLTLSTGFESSSSSFSLVEVLVDAKTGEVLTPIDWSARHKKGNI